MPLTIAMHQPNFAPYLGFFDKMKKSDVFVIRDEALFVKRDFQNRNLIRINSHDNLNLPKSAWITVPVIDPKDYIKYTQIKENAKRRNIIWYQEILNKLQSSYSSAPYFSQFFPQIKEIFENAGKNLTDLNMKIIYLIKSAFQIDTPIIIASELGIAPEHYEKSNSTLRLIDICKKLNAERYLSGPGGARYIDPHLFQEAHVDLLFQEFKHPIYKQNYPGFLMNLSSLDCLFCLGRYPDFE